MATVTFNDQRVKAFLEKIDNKTNSASKAQKAYVNVISARVFRDVIKHFESEMGPEGKWVPWSEGYLIQLRRQGKQGNKKLQDSGRLRNTFKPSSWRKKSEGPEWFNNAKTANGFPYAAHHDDGNSDGKGNSRSFMWLSDTALEDISKMTLAFILR